MTSLYPLKFSPILKERVWGGDSLIKKYGKDYPDGKNIGESWEISAVQNEISVVSNGFLEGNNLQELIEVYMGDLVGEGVFEKFGIEFPLLIKLIDARDTLSIQVHPDDKLARARHHAYGKTEMWYILQAENDAKIYTGFSKKTDKDEFLEQLNNGTIHDILNIETATAGDAFFIPAGRVHAIGRGVVLAEIQQTSDITYRIWDWNRSGLDGNPRELHVDLAVDAIDFNTYDSYKTRVEAVPNGTVNIIDSDYFTTNIFEINKTISKDYSLIDSFVIYICAEGKVKLEWDNDSIMLSEGETILLPATMQTIIINPDPAARILETYIKEDHE